MLLHIYQRKTVVNSYDTTRSINEEWYGIIKNILIESCSSIEDRTVNFIDVGSGTGSFSFLFIKALTEIRDANWKYYAIDNSKFMCDKFLDNLRKHFFQKEYSSNIKLIYGDIESSKTQSLIKNIFFNFVLLAGVLHCLKNPKEIVKFLINKMLNRGRIMVVIQPDSWIKLLCGKFNCDEEIRYYPDIPMWVNDFWKEYHIYRKNLGYKIDERMELACSSEYLINFMKEFREISYLGKRKLTYEMEITPKFLIEAIKKRLYSPLNVPRKISYILGKKMEIYLNKYFSDDLKIKSSKIPLFREIHIWEKIL